MSFFSRRWTRTRRFQNRFLAFDKVRRHALVTLRAEAFEESVLRHYDVTAGITLVPVSTFAFGHQFETTTLNTIRAAGLLKRPK
jgi:hypothetical protein